MLMRMLCCFLAIAAALHAEVLHLGPNKKVQGAVIKETADTVFVDIGATIVAVPKKEIVKREPDAKPKEEAATEAKEKQDGLFRTIRRAEASVMAASKVSPLPTSTSGASPSFQAPSSWSARRAGSAPGSSSRPTAT